MTSQILQKSGIEPDLDNKLPDKVSALLSDLSKQGNAKFDKVLDIVRRNPVTAVVGIFAAGMIAAALISRKAS